MKLSLNTIKYLAEHYKTGADVTAIGVEKLINAIGAQLGAVEESIDYGTRFDGAIVVKVVSCDDHPNADRLHVCMIDDGGVAKGLERNDAGLVQVVCGAPNVRAGLTVVWLPPGATVPESLDKDPFVLESRALRGVVSNGMLASPRELTLGDSHEGILEVTADIAPGTPFVDAFKLRGDVVIDIENKMFTHRPDCFGFLGVARELAGIQQLPFTSPVWYSQSPTVPKPETELLPLEVAIDAGDGVPRFTAMALGDVRVGPSRVALQVELAKHGLRPINNIVDFTNFFMLETGQPLHAYDYDKVVKIAGAQPGDPVVLGARYARDGEQLELLNGKTATLTSSDIVIIANDIPIGLGGVMGGGNTEVDAATSRIIVEVATFDMYAIRRTSMHHGLFTDAVTRFNKGQSPLQNLAVLVRMVDEVRQHAGGKVASELCDVRSTVVDVQLQNGSVHTPVVVTAAFINERLGLTLTPEQIATLLQNVECAVQQSGEALTVTAPFWRTDIEIAEDVVEEVGRLYGYDNLPLELPRRSLQPAVHNATFELQQQLRTALAKAGLNEVLTYSFVHGDLFKKVGQDAELAFQISNALSPDLQYYRLSILPSLLDKVHANIKANISTFALYEFGKAHIVGGKDDDNLPAEYARLAMVYAMDDKESKRQVAGAPYYQAKHVLEWLFGQSGQSAAITYRSFGDVELREHAATVQMLAPFEPKRSAVLWDGVRVVGVVGEFRSSVAAAMKLPKHCAGFEVFLSAFAHVSARTYRPLSRFPKVSQDICLKVPVATPYASVYDLAVSTVARVCADSAIYDVAPVDIFQRDTDKDYKQVTLRLSIADYNRTLTDVEVSKLLDQVAHQAAQTLRAERV